MAQLRIDSLLVIVALLLAACGGRNVDPGRDGC